MRRRNQAIVIAAVSVVLGGCQKSAGPAGIPPAAVADYIHTVIEADRAVYSEQVVHRLQNVEKVIDSTEDFEEEKGLPLPSQMLRMGAQRAAEKGGVRYALISPWAINKSNMPRTTFEKEGLAALTRDPGAPLRRVEDVGGRKYFMALYPDKAVSQACVSCHNEHPESPRTDFALGDVMGAVVVSFPVQ